MWTVRMLTKLSNEAFAVGNGASRRDVDVNALKDRGVVGGCNIVYAEKDGVAPFTPHILIAVDRHGENPVEKILRDEPAVDMVVVPSNRHRNGRLYCPRQPSWTGPTDRGWASGPSLGLVLVALGFTRITLLGMDGGGPRVWGERKSFGSNFLAQWRRLFSEFDSIEWRWVPPCGSRDLPPEWVGSGVSVVGL
jgi:hypothetical protein